MICQPSAGSIEFGIPVKGFMVDAGMWRTSRFVSGVNGVLIIESCTVI